MRLPASVDSLEICSRSRLDLSTELFIVLCKVFEDIWLSVANEPGLYESWTTDIENNCGASGCSKLFCELIDGILGDELGDCVSERSS